MTEIIAFVAEHQADAQLREQIKGVTMIQGYAIDGHGNKVAVQKRLYDDGVFFIVHPVSTKNWKRNASVYVELEPMYAVGRVLANGGLLGAAESFTPTSHRELVAMGLIEDVNHLLVDLIGEERLAERRGLR